MRRRIVLTTIALLVTLCLVIVKPVAQQPIVDSQKSRQELQTMEGILSTTLGFAVQRLNGNQAAEGDRVFKFHRMDGGDVNGYYVYGQGAVFMIPISALQRHQEMDFAFAMPDIEALVAPAVKVGLAAAAASMEAISEGEVGEVDSEKAKEKAEKLQKQTEEQKKELTQKIEKQKEKMQQFQEQAKKRRAEMEQRHKELIGRLDQIKVDLKDALARYGDSLSIVKPEESVTIILSDGGGFKWGDMEGANICHVLTVKKSLATDLKSGKITREEFNRRVVDYSY